MSAGCGVGGPDRLNTGHPGPGLEQLPTVDGPAPTVGRSVSSQRSLCRLWNSLCPPESNRKRSVRSGFDFDGASRVGLEAEQGRGNWSQGKHRVTLKIPIQGAGGVRSMICDL